MPIKAEPETVRAVRAFFTAPDGNNAKTGEADKLRAELAQSQEEAAALRGDLYRAANEITELKNKLAEQHETKSEQPAAETVEPKTAAEIIAARWAEVDGLTATIKGAATAAPVVWLSGDTKPHAKSHRGRRRQVERQEERLLFPRRLTQNPQGRRHPAAAGASPAAPRRGGRSWVNPKPKHRRNKT